MKKRRKVTMILGLIVVLLLVVIPIACTIFIYEMNFIELDLRGHECLRTLEIEKKLQGVKSDYQALKEIYGSKGYFEKLSGS